MIRDSQEIFDLFQSSAKYTPQFKADRSSKFSPSPNRLEEGIDVWVISDTSNVKEIL